MTRIAIEVYKRINIFTGCDPDTLEPIIVHDHEKVYESCTGFNKCDDATVFELWKDVINRVGVPLQFREEVNWSEFYLFDEEVKYIAHTDSYEYEIDLIGLRDARKKVKKEYYIKKVYSDGKDLISMKYDRIRVTSEWWFDNEESFKNMLSIFNPDYKLVEKDSSMDADGEKLSVIYAEQKGITAGYSYEYKD
jgi:hypothetical protein